ncbi:MAG: molybdate ABC transporter substrate-binding protein [Oscillospiraceae bacterium]|nr:molybdate ABC transporter substrate-binding protein [Oscillospiraceae bacterium]
MKKIISVLCAAGMAVSLAACSNNSGTVSPTPSASSETESPDSAVELHVYAAASMTETLNEIAELYKQVAPDVTLTYTFDSSGTLKTQIEMGADADIFISAAQKQMNQLDITSSEEVNPDRLDFVLSNTRIDLLQNKVVLVVPDGNAAGITSFEDLGTDKLSLLALGNADVPVGQYAEQILTYMGIWDTLNDAQKITFASDVKEVVSQVAGGSVDAGIVYATDAAPAGLEVVAYAPEDAHEAVIYPAAVLNTTSNEAAAQEFLTYLTGPEATAVFEAAGFSVP